MKLVTLSFIPSACLYGAVVSADVLGKLRLFKSAEQRAAFVVETPVIVAKPVVKQSGAAPPEQRGRAVVRGARGEQRISDGVPQLVIR